MSVPQSTVYLCKGVRLNNRYEHTIYWASTDAQLSYFMGKVARTYSAYTYLRKSWNIKVSATMSEARQWDYLFFRNSDGKYWYYFINNIEYISDNAVELTLELDVMQTYACDYQLLECFVERQHVDNDDIGRHLVDEGLELGELVVNSDTQVSLAEMRILVLSSVDLVTVGEEFAVSSGQLMNGRFSGLRVYSFTTSNFSALGLLLDQLDEAGKADAILSIWMYPAALVNETGDTTARPTSGAKSIFEYVGMPYKLASTYTPRNNKLLSYPFNQLYITNNSGGGASLRYELFGNPDECGFKIVGDLGADANVRMYPLNYNGMQHAYEYGLNLGNFPTCAWSSDVFKMWVAQNQGQHSMQLATAGLGIAGGVVSATFGGMGALAGGSAVVSGLAQIGDLVAQRHDMQVQPPQAKGAASSNINLTAGFQTFNIQKKSINQTYARIIDDFFDLYGYKLNRVMVPNRAAREKWTYIKTVGCHIAGDFCTEDLTKIESIFDRGITFWRNGDIANYSQSNFPV